MMARLIGRIAACLALVSLLAVPVGPVDAQRIGAHRAVVTGQRLALSYGSVFQEVRLLRTNQALTGSRITSGYKVPGVDALPTGFSYNGTTKRINNTAGTGGFADLSGWDFRGCYLTLMGNVGNISDNLIGDFTSGAAAFLIDIYATAVVGSIHHNTFTGAGLTSGLSAAINGRVTVPATAANVGEIAYNKFSGFPSDVLAVGFRPNIHHNYFDTPLNLTALPALWDAGTTYVIGDYVRRDSGGVSYIFKSLVNGNINNQPPAAKTDTAQWDNIDPHVDMITIKASTGSGAAPGRVYRNYINMRNDDRVAPGGGYAFGVNNGIRGTRDGGSTADYDLVVFEENIIVRDATLNSVPVQLATVGAGVTASTLQNNWIRPSATGALWYPGNEAFHTIAGNIAYAP